MRAESAVRKRCPFGGAVARASRIGVSFKRSNGAVCKCAVLKNSDGCQTCSATAPLRFAAFSRRLLADKVRGLPPMRYQRAALRATKCEVWSLHFDPWMLLQVRGLKVRGLTPTRGKVQSRKFQTVMHERRFQKATKCEVWPLHFDPWMLLQVRGLSLTRGLTCDQVRGLTPAFLHFDPWMLLQVRGLSLTRGLTCDQVRGLAPAFRPLDAPTSARPVPNARPYLRPSAGPDPCILTLECVSRGANSRAARVRCWRRTNS